MPEPDREFRPCPRNLRMLRRHALLIAAVCMPFATGGSCSGDGGGGNISSSTQTATNDLSASMTASVVAPDVVRVSVRFCCTPATFFDSGGDNLKLERGESLVATVGGSQRRLVASGASVSRYYTATFDNVPPESRVEVVHYRADGSKVRSATTLVPEFEMTYPRPGEVFDITDELVLEWTPAYRQTGRYPAVLVVFPRIECLRLDGVKTSRTFRWQIRDDGQYVYDLAKLPERTNEDLDRSVDCTLDFALTRNSSESVASSYRSGSFGTSVRRELNGVIIRL